jgi:hypothetical protein
MAMIARYKIALLIRPPLGGLDYLGTSSHVAHGRSSVRRRAPGSRKLPAEHAIVSPNVTAQTGDNEHPAGRVVKIS